MGKNPFWSGAGLGAVLLALAGCASDTATPGPKQVAALPCETCSPLSGSDAACTELDGEVIVQMPLYCYQSLGTVDCYSEPNPYPTERSPRVRKVPPLASLGAPYVSVSEYERLKTGQRLGDQ